MSDRAMGAAERELMEMAAYLLDNLDNYPLYSIDSNLADACEKVYEESLDEESAALRDVIFLEKKMQELQKQVDDCERGSQRLDREQDSLERDLKKCRIWELARKKSLKEQLRRIKAKPRASTELLEELLRLKKSEVRQAYAYYRPLEERRKRLGESISRIRTTRQKSQKNRKKY